MHDFHVLTPEQPTTTAPKPIVTWKLFLSETSDRMVYFAIDYINQVNSFPFMSNRVSLDFCHLLVNKPNFCSLIQASNNGVVLIQPATQIMEAFLGKAFVCSTLLLVSPSSGWVDFELKPYLVSRPGKLTGNYLSVRVERWGPLRLKLYTQ